MWFYSCSRDVGTVSKTLDKGVNWTIPNINSFTVPYRSYVSPSFRLSGNKWFLRIYPNGVAEHASGTNGWISLFLHRDNDFRSADKLGVTLNFGLRRTDGKVEWAGNSLSCTFCDDTLADGRGLLLFLRRDDLLRRSSEGARHTLTCRISGFKGCGDPNFRTMSENFRIMFLRFSSYDVTLRLKDRHDQFFAHRAILSAKSSFFAAKFETMTGKNIIVDIEEDNWRVFKDFLGFIYTGFYHNLMTTVSGGLYVMAVKYGVPELKSKCVHAIVHSVTSQNVCQIATFNKRYGEKDIDIPIQYLFSQHFEEIAATDQWKSLLKKNPSLAEELMNNRPEK